MVGTHFELGSDPKRSAAHELVVFGIHDSVGYIMVDNVKGEVKHFGMEMEGEVDLDEKVNQTRMHVPPDLGLLVHGGGGGHCTKLFWISQHILTCKSEGKCIVGLTSISCMYLRMLNRYSSSNRHMSGLGHYLGLTDPLEFRDNSGPVQSHGVGTAGGVLRAFATSPWQMGEGCFLG